MKPTNQPHGITRELVKMQNLCLLFKGYKLPAMGLTSSRNLMYCMMTIANNPVLCPLKLLWQYILNFLTTRKKKKKRLSMGCRCLLMLWW